MTREEIIALVNEMLSNGAEEIDLGKVGITPKKDYSSTANYEYLDIVTYDGCSYMCLKDCIGVAVSNIEYWQLLADKGHFTQEDKEEFKQAVVRDSKTEINGHTETKKTELDNYTTEKETSLKNELDTYTESKQTELDTKRTELETEMTNTKNSLVAEIETAQSGFDTNAQTKLQNYNDNATAKTTAFNNNVTEKTNTFNSNTETKITEFNNNSTAKIQEFDEHTEAINENIVEIKQDLVDIGVKKIISKNKFNPNTLQTGKLVNENGVVTINENYATTDFIAVTPLAKISVFFKGSVIATANVKRIIAFDSNKNFVANLGGLPYSTTPAYVEIPADAKYILVSSVLSAFETLGTIMICEFDGITMPSEIVEYIEPHAELTGFVTAEEYNAEKLKERINELEGIVAQMPSVEGSGSDFKLDNTIDAQMLDVKVEGTTSQVQYSEKNLFDINSSRTTAPNTTNTKMTINENIMELEAVGTVGAQNTTYVLENFDSTKEYTFSCKCKKIVLGTDGAPRIRMSIYGSVDGTNFSNLKLLDVATPVASTEYSLSYTTTGYSYYKVMFYNNCSTPVTLGEKTRYYNIQIEEGQTATAYEPYVGGTASPNVQYQQPIHNVSGDVVIKSSTLNLIDVKTENTIKSTLSAYNNFVTNNDKKYIMINGKTLVGIKCKVKPNTKYSVQYSTSTLINEVDKALRVREFSSEPSEWSGENFIGQTVDTNYSSKNPKHTFTTSENTKWILLVVYIGFVPATPFIIQNWRVNEGDSIIDVEHKESTVTFPLAPGQFLAEGDYLAEDGIHKVMQERIITGDKVTGGYATADSETTLGFYVGKGYANDVIANQKNIYCTHFKQGNVTMKISGTIACLANNVLYFCISKKYATNVDEVRALFDELNEAGTPVKVLYRSTNEEIIQYTPEQQTAYNELKKLRSFADVTYVLTSSGDLSPVAEVKALEKVAGISEIDNIKQAIVALGGTL